MKSELNDMHLLRETIKYLLRTPDLNLDELEEDTVEGIENARAALEATDYVDNHFMPWESN